MENYVFLVVRTNNSSFSGNTESVCVCASKAEAMALVAAVGWPENEVEIRRLTVMDSEAIARIRERREARESCARETFARAERELREAEAGEVAWAAFVARRPECAARQAPESRCRSSKRIAFHCEVAA